MLRLVSAGPVRIVCPWDSGEHATVFTVRQASATEWAAFDAAVEAQREGKKDGIAAARATSEQMCEQAGNFTEKIENAYEPGDALTARSAIVAYLHDLNAMQLGWIVGCIRGVSEITAFEKKASASPCEPSQSSSDSTKKAGQTPTTVEPAEPTG